MSEYIFKLPDLGEGTVESEIGEWNVKVGDVVSEDAVLGTMMTDKAAIELNSPVSGTVKSLAGEPGDMIAVGEALVVFETDASTAATPGAPAPEAPETRPAVATAKEDKVITSPAIRRRAKQAGIDLATITGSGPGGRILRQDFEQHVQGMQGSAAPAAIARTPEKTGEVKVIGLRRVIAERMTEANREVPHFSYVEEIDITALEALRQHLNNKKADKADRLTLLPFLGLALI
ncbi:MAG: biotin/lipoyl-containing protein, partial [Woeseiaceae bacterium]|nr:biotin/lipoyl-containing protein [Woeseiaceae bacterium]